MEVDVEVLDVDDAEARALLLSIDPLARLADYDAGKLDALRAVTDADSDALANLWRIDHRRRRRRREDADRARRTEPRRSRRNSSSCWSSAPTKRSKPPCCSASRRKG